MKILIAGQGLAGSALAVELVRKGAAVKVADLPGNDTSTRVAAGVVRPITGRHLAKTHQADRLIPKAFEFYRSVEASTGNTLFHHKEVLQLFVNPAAGNDWYGRAAEPGYERYIGQFLEPHQIPRSLKGPHGGVLLQQCGHLDTNRFLDVIRNQLTQNGNYVSSHVDMDALELKPDGVLWQQEKFDRVVFCTGASAAARYYFENLPFRPVKGEILDFVADQLTDDFIVNCGNFFLPVSKGRFRVGATYNWEQQDVAPTEAARSQLVDWLSQTISVPFEITGHRAGMRPAVSDRRPLLGLHTERPQVAIFNGLGSKGVLLAPYYADQMADVLLGIRNPDPEVDIRRFF